MVPITIRALQRRQGRNPPRPERDMAKIAHLGVAKRSQGMTLASALRLELNDFGAYHAPNPECRYSLETAQANAINRRVNATET